MNLLHMADQYIAQHARNLGADVIQHLKAFATKAHAEMTAVVAEAPAEVAHVETEAKAAVETVEAAVHELETHAEGSFEHLLKAQSEGNQ